jgi:hypothetical protein
MAMKDYSRMDEALAFLAPYGPELANGFTNHAPMVSEALAAMGRADAVMGWLDSEKENLLPRPKPVHAIDPDQWDAALGNHAPADWSALAARELATQPWREVAGRWSARLAPGIPAAAAHGAIRTGHAVRSLTERETPVRIRELADALGYWASAYFTLPAAAGAAAPTNAREAIGRVPRVIGHDYRGTITATLAALKDVPGFAETIGYLDTTVEPERNLSDLTETFARVFLANAHDRLSTIVLIHGVTGAAAVRSLLPVLLPQAARDAVRFAWQTGAALYAAFATQPPVPDADAPAGGRETFISAAVASGDDHAIKFTETCLREYDINPSPVYLAAARHAISLLG